GLGEQDRSQCHDDGAGPQSDAATPLVRGEKIMPQQSLQTWVQILAVVPLIRVPMMREATPDWQSVPHRPEGSCAIARRRFATNKSPSGAYRVAGGDWLQVLDLGRARLDAVAAGDCGHAYLDHIGGVLAFGGVEVLAVHRNGAACLRRHGVIDVFDLGAGRAV